MRLGPCICRDVYAMHVNTAFYVIRSLESAPPVEWPVSGGGSGGKSEAEPKREINNNIFKREMKEGK